MDEIHIPEGINFECTGCGNCCLKWPVPITDEDRRRIEGHIDTTGKDLFRPLFSVYPKLKGFTHTLEKRPDGKCEFLTDENRCFLHQEFGAQAKPAMCQLFPYTFNPTPSGIYASVSFASTGVLLNSGCALSEQAPHLREQYDLFCRLFPDIQSNWLHLQLADGHPLTWSEYMALDQEMQRRIKETAPRRIESRLQNCSRFLIKQLHSGIDPERAPRMEAGAKTIDWLLLKALRRFYLPADVFENEQTDLDSKMFLGEIVQPPNVVRFECYGEVFTAQDIIKCELGELDDATEDLLYRFAYCRIFAKLYFGFGFANLSVIVGLHHLTILLAMLRLEIKIRQLRCGQKVDFLEVVEMVRTLERRLTIANLSRESTAVLETLLKSPQRLERIIFLAS